MEMVGMVVAKGDSLERGVEEVTALGNGQAGPAGPAEKMDQKEGRAVA